MVLNAESCNDVAIWMMFTIIPTAKPMSNSGAQSNTVVQNAWLIMWITASGVICSSIEALQERADYQVPPVHQNE